MTQGKKLVLPPPPSKSLEFGLEQTKLFMQSNVL
uniref:Uncharacterized protein n=1 Tax=viral metagenome TaxID=1070528 RepID=A0A6C0AZM1_9ZZZZ